MTLVVLGVGMLGVVLALAAVAWWLMGGDWWA